MAVVNNTCSAPGDVLFISSQASVSGNIISLTSYTDTVIGETMTRFFNRSFRVSNNGIIWTSWLPLTNPNLNSISGQVSGILYFEFAYERAGSDTTGLLEFFEIVINGDITAFSCISVTTHLSIFNNYACGSVVTAEICNNLLKKLYMSGIIPEYLIRGEGGVADEDYVAFWATIACYFAMIVSYTHQFEQILNDRKLLLEYLREEGMYMCSDDITLSDLQWLANNFYDEIRKRGTIQVFKRKGFVLEDSSVVPVDGEYLRLLCSSGCDEFLVSITRRFKGEWNLGAGGWNLGNSSPMYKGTSFEDQLIKGVEKTRDFVDLNNYVKLNPGNMSIVPDTYNNGDSINVCKIDNIVPGGISGFGNTSFGYSIGGGQTFLVDFNIDYEITFFIKQEDVANLVFDFGVLSYTCENVPQGPFKKVDSNVYDMWFFQNAKVANNGKYYFVRGIIYNAYQPTLATQDSRTNLNIGVHKKFFSTTQRKMQPFLFVRNTGGVNSGAAYIWDYKVRPLRAQYSLGFLNSTNFLQIWSKKNNSELTYKEIKIITRKYLIPYNCIPVWTWLTNPGEITEHA